MDDTANRSGGRRHPVTVRTAKVGHKKTRTGCLTCRQRKVKCDEGMPECYNCIRLRLPCSYTKRPEKGEVSNRRNVAYSESTSSPEMEGPFMQHQYPPMDDSMAIDSDSVLEHDRMALRLLHSWMSKGLRLYNMAAMTEWRKVWLIDVPELALSHDYLLYALLALSATQLSGSTGPDPDLTVARYKYWTLALSKQQTMIARRSPSDVEPVTFAALLIAINAFAMLRDRDIQPYQPPVDWLEVSKGFWDICPNRETVTADSSLAKIMDGTASIWGSKKDSILPIYQPILRQYSPEDSYCDTEVYEETLTFISAFREGVQNNEPGYHHVRRICIFAQTVPRGFIKFLQERRPRALVILAAFFVVVAHSDALTYFGDVNGVIPRREVHSIAQMVPSEWQGIMMYLTDEVES